MLFCFKNLTDWKQEKAILTIVIGLKDILHWNLVKCVLDKEDKSISVYSPLFNFLFVVSVSNVLVLLCLVFVDYKECL